MDTLQILGSFMAGGAGWFATQFVGRPIRQFWDLRGEVIRQMAQFANVPARWKEVPDNLGKVEDMGLSEKKIAELEQAQTTFRDLASRMRSFADNEFWAVRILRFSYDPRKASAALFGLSNSIDTYGGNRAFQKEIVEKALRIRSSG